MVKSSKPASEFKDCQSPGESKRIPLLIAIRKFRHHFQFLRQKATSLLDGLVADPQPFPSMPSKDCFDAIRFDSQERPKVGLGQGARVIKASSNSQSSGTLKRKSQYPHVWVFVSWLPWNGGYGNNFNSQVLRSKTQQSLTAALGISEDRLVAKDAVRVSLKAERLLFQRLLARFSQSGPVNSIPPSLLCFHICVQFLTNRQMQ